MRVLLNDGSEDALLSRVIPAKRPFSMRVVPLGRDESRIISGRETPREEEPIYLEFSNG